MALSLWLELPRVGAVVETWCTPTRQTAQPTCDWLELLLRDVHKRQDAADWGWLCDALFHIVYHCHQRHTTSKGLGWRRRVEARTVPPSDARPALLRLWLCSPLMMHSAMSPSSVYSTYFLALQPGTLHL